MADHHERADDGVAEAAAISNPAGGSSVRRFQAQPGPSAHDEHVEHRDQGDGGEDGGRPGAAAQQQAA